MLFKRTLLGDTKELRHVVAGLHGKFNRAGKMANVMWALSFLGGEIASSVSSW